MTLATKGGFLFSPRCQMAINSLFQSKRIASFYKSYIPKLSKCEMEAEEFASL